MCFSCIYLDVLMYCVGVAFVLYVCLCVVDLFKCLQIVVLLVDFSGSEDNLIPLGGYH